MQPAELQLRSQIDYSGDVHATFAAMLNHAP
jgi:hypothetical protein